MGNRKAALAYTGPGATVVEARDPSIAEDLLGITGVLLVRTQPGSLATLGCGVHRGVPFAVPGLFPMPGAELTVPDEDRRLLERYAQVHGLSLAEARRDGRGLAYLARSSAGPVILRLAQGSPIVEALEPQTSTLTRDQACWIRFQITYSGCLLLDAWHDGGEALVVLKQPRGVVKYGLNEDGCETWARPYEGGCPYA